MTVVWTVVGFLVGALVATGCIYLVVGGNPVPHMEKSDNGVVIAVTTISSNIVWIAVLAAAIHFRHWPVGKYLALPLPRRSVIVRAFILMIALLVIVEVATALVGQNNVPPFQVNSYRSAKEAGWLPGLFAAVVVFAPLTEEIVFRGFLYRGFVRRPGHEPIAILIISLLWTALHIQYDFWGLAQIFAVGILLGALRWWSGSTGLTVLLHVMANFLATIETVFYVEYLSK